LENTYYYFKTDVFKGLVSYSTSQSFGANVVTITAQRAKEVIALNRKGIKPDLLDDRTDEEINPVQVDYENGVGQDSLTRFDTNKKRSGKSNNRKNNKPQFAKSEKSDNKSIAPRFEKPIKKNDIDTTKNEK